MGQITERAKSVFAAGPSVAPFNPDKGAIVGLNALIEASLTSVVEGIVVGGAVVHSSRATLFANLSPSSGSLGVVYNDSNGAFNGVYVKSGASGTGSWSLTKLALPATFAQDLTNTQSEIVAARSGNPTLGAHLTVIEEAAGALTNEVLDARGGRASLGTRITIIENEARAAGDARDVAIAARDIAVSAKTAAETAEASAESAQTAAELARDIAEGYASDAVSQGNVPIYATVLGMSGITVPVGMNVIRINGYAEAGDGHGGLFKRSTSEPSALVKFQSAGGVWWGLAPAGRNIGDTPLYEMFDGKPTIRIGPALYFKKDAPGVYDVFDSHFYRDTTGLSGGTPGFVNSTLLVNTKTGADEVSFTWGLLSKLYNQSEAGENVAIYAQAIKAAEGHTWGICVETNELPTATYGAIVGIENALSVNGLDPSNIRVVQDVLGVRYDKNEDVPDIYAGVRILAAWGGNVDGTNSARFKRPLLIDANWTETAIYAVHRSGVGVGAGNRVVVFDGYAFDPNQDNMQLRFARTGPTDSWTDTAVQLDRYVDGVFVGRVAINGDKSVELNTGETSFKLKNGGGIVIPFYATDPPTAAQGELYFNSTTEQLRIYTGSAWASFTHV